MDVARLVVKQLLPEPRHREGDAMRTLTKCRIAIACIAALLTGATVFGQEKSGRSLELLMGGNFQIIARILSDLVEGRYESIPPQADLMIRHASELAASPPANLQGAAERAVFVSYAMNLKLAATQLGAVSRRLAKRTPQRADNGDFSLEYLQSSAAQQFGNVVSACTICHSQLRRPTL